MKSTQITEMLINSLTNSESTMEETISLTENLHDIEGFDNVKVTQEISLSPIEPTTGDPGDFPRLPDIRNPDDIISDLIRRLRGLDVVGKESCTTSTECWYEGDYGSGGVRRVCKTTTVCAGTGD